jgi:hypothetical protein
MKKYSRVLAGILAVLLSSQLRLPEAKAIVEASIR